MTIQEELNGVNKRIAELSKSLAPLLEANQKSIADHGVGLDGVIEAISKFGAEVTDLTGKQAHLTTEVAGMQAAGSAAAKATPKRPRSLARRIAEDKVVQSWMKSRGTDACRIEVGPLWSQKEDVIGPSDVDATDIIVPQFVRPPIAIAQPMAIMRSLCTVLPTTETNLVNVGKESEFNKLITGLTADEGIGSSTFAVVNANGFDDYAPFSTITLDNGTTTEVLTIDTAGVDIDAKTLTTTAVSTIALTVANGSIRGTRYRPTPAGLVAPRSNKKFIDKKIPIVDLDSKMVVTLNQLNDVPSLETTLRQNLLTALAEMEDVNFFYANGNGISTMQGVYFDPALITSTTLWSAQTAGTSLLDFIINQFYDIVQTDNYIPNTVLVSPDVHRDLVKLKASDGQYIFWSQATEGAAPSNVFAMRLMMTNTLVAQSCIVADFATAFYIADRESAEVEIGRENDQLSLRERTLLAVERVGFGVVKPEAARLLTMDSKP